MIRSGRISRLRALHFLRRQDGATAVEFMILMPIMLLTFAAIVDGARVYWNYQAAVSGVRDAARYVARTTDPGLCAGKVNATYRSMPAAASTTARQIITRNLGTGGESLFPVAVSLGNVSASYACPDHNLRRDPTPVARINATVDIDLPLAGLMNLVRGTRAGQVNATITDQSRIYGL